MSDLAPENAESDLAPEGAGNMAPTVYADNVDDAESNSLAKPLLLIWNTVMLVSTAVLSFYVFVLKDNSAVPFVILGITGLSLPPIVGMFRTRARNKQLRIEFERRLEEIRQERIRQAKEREMERLKREKILEANEQGIQEALKSVDVEAYKINNSMESSAGGL